MGARKGGVYYCFIFITDGVRLTMGHGGWFVVGVGESSMFISYIELNCVK